MDRNLENAILLVRLLAFGSVAAFAAIDLFLLVRFGPAATISIMLRELGDRWGLFPDLIAFGMGALFYHLFGPGYHGVR